MWSDLTLGPLQGQTRISKLKSAYNSLVIGPRGLQCATILKKIMGWEFFDVVSSAVTRQCKHTSNIDHTCQPNTDICRHTFTVILKQAFNKDVL